MTGPAGPRQDHARTKDHFRGVVRIHVSPVGSCVHAPRMATYVIKALPKHRRVWDARTTCWRVHTGDLPTVTADLCANGWTVRVIGPGEPPPPVQLATRTINGPTWRPEP